MLHMTCNCSSENCPLRDILCGERGQFVNLIDLMVAVRSCIGRNLCVKVEPGNGGVTLCMFTLPSIPSFVVVQLPSVMFDILGEMMDPLENEGLADQICEDADMFGIYSNASEGDNGVSDS